MEDIHEMQFSRLVDTYETPLYSRDDVCERGISPALPMPLRDVSPIIAIPMRCISTAMADLHDGSLYCGWRLYSRRQFSSRGGCLREAPLYVMAILLEASLLAWQVSINHCGHL